MKNKRGQELSVGTLILIVIGIVFLVLIILGFSMGWGNLWDKLNIFGDSMSAMVAKCNTLSSDGDYCSFGNSEVKLDGKKRWVNCDYPNVRKSLDVSKQKSCDVKTIEDKCVAALTDKYKANYDKAENNVKESIKKDCEADKLVIVNDATCGTADYCGKALSAAAAK